MPTIRSTPDFDKCVDELGRYRHIEEDIDTFKQALLGCFPKQIPRTHIIPGFGEGVYPVYKVEKFHSTDLRDNTRMRVVYTYDPEKDEIILIEIYFKGKRENHNCDVIKKHLVKKN